MVEGKNVTEAEYTWAWGTKTLNYFLSWHLYDSLPEDAPGKRRIRKRYYRMALEGTRGDNFQSSQSLQDHAVQCQTLGVMQSRYPTAAPATPSPKAKSKRTPQPAKALAMTTAEILPTQGATQSLIASGGGGTLATATTQWVTNVAKEGAISVLGVIFPEKVNVIPLMAIFMVILIAVLCIGHKIGRWSERRAIHGDEAQPTVPRRFYDEVRQLARDHVRYAVRVLFPTAKMVVYITPTR